MFDVPGHKLTADLDQAKSDLRQVSANLLQLSRRRDALLGLVRYLEHIIKTHGGNACQAGSAEITATPDSPE